MEFCKALKKALDRAPSPEARDAVQAVIDAHCGDVSAQDGGSPPTPGGGNGNGPPGGGG